MLGFIILFKDYFNTLLKICLLGGGRYEKKGKIIFIAIQQVEHQEQIQLNHHVSFLVLFDKLILM